MNIKKQIIVTQEYDKQRIDVVLAKLLPEYSRSQLSSWLKQGLITLNQGNCKPKDRVECNDVIDICVDAPTVVSEHPELPADIPINVIFDDDALLIVNKPAGMVVHPGAGNRTHTLMNALLHHYPNQSHLPRAGIIHRLDKDTTGLLIIAKTLAAHTYFIRQMQAHQIERQYIALVSGHIIAGGEINTYFGRHPKDYRKMAVAQQGRQAITMYRVRQHYQHYTLLEVQLLTGRTHQIRVHMAHIKHPIVGDPLYGGRARIPAKASLQLQAALTNFQRQALHAHIISFTHPYSQEKLTFKAALPDDFGMLLNTIESENG